MFPKSFSFDHLTQNGYKIIQKVIFALYIKITNSDYICTRIFLFEFFLVHQIIPHFSLNWNYLQVAYKKNVMQQHQHSGSNHMFLTFIYCIALVLHLHISTYIYSTIKRVVEKSRLEFSKRLIIMLLIVPKYYLSNFKILRFEHCNWISYAWLFSLSAYTYDDDYYVKWLHS